jgi:multiple sugar transport system ATP-binding protein
MSSPLSCTNIVKSYGAKTVLANLSFEASPGEFIVLVGPSGCGKSTLLRSIAGLESLSSGTIRIGDRDVTQLAPKDRDIAMVFQDYALYPHKSVFENIAFGLRIRRFPEAQIRVRVLEAAKKLDLEALLERKPAALSGGQRQRVAIGRAIVRDPKVFLFDEPLSNLDAKLRGTMRVSIAKLHKELNATIVYVTHDQVEAMTLADKIIVLEAGRIQQMGTPLDLYYHPSNIFVATFIGTPPMNLVDGRLVDEGGRLAFRSARGLTVPLGDGFRAQLKPEAKPGQEVVWGVRSENLKLVEDGRPLEGPTFASRVIVHELLGPTTQVLCDIAGHEVYVTLSAPHRPTRGTQLQLELRSKHLYLFDKKTSQSLIK